jgi:hypothetical protein
MEYTDYMLLKAGVIVVLAIVWNFWKGLNGK